MKIMALIPARSGSKSIPKKNIIDFGGHPLLAYSIAAARLSKYINRIIVSTDSEEYAQIARKYGAETPFLRPAEISGDKSLDIDFFRHALDWLEKNEGYVPDYIVELRPTTPLRETEVIDKAISEIMQDSQATGLRSGHVHKDPGYKLFKKKGDYIEFFGREDFGENEEYHYYPRQSLPVTYSANNGYVDVIRPSTLKNTGMLLGKKIRAFITEKVDDLDDWEDFLSAAKKLDQEKYKPLRDLLDKTKQ